ncbi:Na(+)/H(+) antiporter nhaA (plasmid) [Emticicia oligotrophica DSM 17448]|uniref:Na(+)/H(+) antiporter NhaA n=1 Tax=Emticicia oligotrophica (strain DSM 17448 / CIP 109782 / MTCC 6937 / GPTSA100-15) TaxID=929562 RepID=A0ABM5N7S7_EMTOG|nr:Na+/H+ antiporter NhaA [Emticicia oligotrophica]AFK05556.1 Na(+)/H(+) antiporter nhaA [Emticicia oligotrophica DSM 17448]
MKVTKLFKDFFESERAGGFILIACTLISIYISNSVFQTEYLGFWEQKLGSHSITGWINDGLMTFLFLLVGLELEREIYLGELSNLKNALLPISGALGGMIFPAIIYGIFNWGTTTQSGIGIPMATDIAFALGILSLLGNRVPTSLKIFLTALAVIDDLGAIIVIAIFYTKTLVFTDLSIALSIFALLLMLNRLKVRNLIPYLIGGIFMWYFMLHSGVHATITGVLLAFSIPFGNGNEKSSSYILQHFLHRPVAFIILPLFALANTAIMFKSGGWNIFGELHSIGIFLGLVVGKPLGITLVSFILVVLGICKLPNDLNWKHILGAGFLGGIGFTISIFVTLLAFENEVFINQSKLTVLFASIISALIGLVWLHKSLNLK